MSRVKGGKIADILAGPPPAGPPVWACHCHRCDHDWASRNPLRAPIQCPKCKSLRWHTPRTDNRGNPQVRAEQAKAENLT